MSSHNTYITIKTTQIDNISWGQENIVGGKDTLRYSLDGLEFVIKWNNKFNTPPSVLAIPTDDKSQLMSHSQVLLLMDSSNWISPNPPT